MFMIAQCFRNTGHYQSISFNLGKFVFGALFTASKDGNVGTKEKMVTATKKGAAVLDQWLPDQIKTQYHVLQVASLNCLSRNDGF